MQWLNSLDDAVDRISKAEHSNHRPQKEIGEPALSTGTSHDVPGPLHQEFIIPQPAPNDTASPDRKISSTSSSQFENFNNPSSGVPPIVPQSSLLDDESNTETRTMQSPALAIVRKVPQSSFWRNATISSSKNGLSENGAEKVVNQLQFTAVVQISEVASENKGPLSDVLLNLLDSNPKSSDKSEKESSDRAFRNGSGPKRQQLNPDSPARVQSSDKDFSKLAWTSSTVQFEKEDYSDFPFSIPLPSWDGAVGEPFVPEMNSYGVFHVRLLRAQRLPCPAGSSVHAFVSLPPWQGRVRTESTLAFLTTSEHGVCIRWEQLSDAGLCSMMNAWSSKESPVPSIKIELMFSPLGMGVFVLSMCTLDLTCETLMKSPGTWKTQWCQATVAPLQTASGKEYLADDRKPFIEVEAMFSPTTTESHDRASASDDGSIEVESGQETELPLVDFLDQSNRSVRFPVDDADASTIKSFGTNAPMNPSQPHLLRAVSIWLPATCSVCSKIMMGRNQGFHCEVCDIHCCSDCRLNVDFQISCGSGAARRAVESSLQSRFSISNILSVVAPVAEGYLEKKALDSDDKNGSTAPNSSHGLINAFKEQQEPGIGCLKLQFVKACLFERAVPADTELDDVIESSKTRGLQRGDYYARVSWTGSKQSSRTRNLQSTGNLLFNSREMRFDVAHYGIEYRLEVIDAATDTAVGTALISTQGMLQQQRDLMVTESGASVLQFLQGPIRFEGKRRLTLELRTDVKNGFSPAFFVSSKYNRTASSDGKTQPGDISGWIEVLVGLEEDVGRLYGREHPFECPPRPPADLNMINFQNHIARIGALLADAKTGLDKYNYMVSWKNPSLTILSLIIFVIFCLRFNAEYSGSLPFFFLILCMLHFAWNRGQGGIKNRFIRKEIEACRKEGDVSVNYTLHRPIGSIDVAVLRGKHLRSRELGLTGKIGCQIYWDPVRYGNESTKKATTSLDKAAASNHQIGSTDSHYTAEPVWDEIHDSDESRRLKQLLPSKGDFFESSQDITDSRALQFPILQPFKVMKSSMNDSNRYLNGRLEPWATSPGAVVFEVRFQDILNSLPGFDDVLGEVAIPFSKLAEAGEISGWFKVLEVGVTRVAPGEDEALIKPSPAAPSGENADSVAGNETPQIFLALKWTPPDTTTEPTETDREASVVIQEEFVRSSIISRANKVDLVGSSIGALNTALGIGGNVQFVQNTLGSLMDILEGIRNAFNFTDPYKSSVLFALLVVIWIFLALIPTRFIVLLAGLAQYAATFFGQYGHVFQSKKKRPNSPMDTSSESEVLTNRDDGENKSSPIVTWIMNAIRGLPTDEDLRKTYFWESRRRGARESEKHAAEKRLSRLQRLWKAQWHAIIKLRTQSTQRMGSVSPRTSSSSDCKSFPWETVFAMVQGHRFLWWQTVRDFDNGEPPSGRIFLSGHAGLTGPSPLEMRELSAEELPLVVGIFGRGLKVQERIIMLASNVQVKECLESAVLGASLKDD
jgi:hypothetical protein